MNHTYEACYSRVILLPICNDDIEKMRLLRNRNRNCFIYSKEITYQEQMEWFNKYIIAENDFMFSVRLKDSPEEFIGMSALYNINLDDLSAEFGRIVIDKDVVKQKGLGFDVTVCTCKIAFEQLNLNSVILEVYDDNISAKKTYERAGFKKVQEYLTKDNRKIEHMHLEKVNFKF